ncbi:MAG TPA: membrane protein insertion efficiency factor YidD [Candidatus Paceibacterota bacterium]
MQAFLIKLISLYQRLPRKPSCRFYPTCSEYAKGSIQKHGAARGAYFSFVRVLRCHPWQKNHIDPVK